MNQLIFEQFTKETSEVHNDFLRAQEVYVNVTHVIDPSNFYIRPSVHNKYIRMIETMQPTAPFKPERLDVVLIKSGDIIKRGQVYGTNGNCVKVYTLDYGETLTNVPEQDVMEIPKVLRQLPSMSILCSLFLMEPVIGREWSQQAINTMKDLVMDKKVKIVMESWHTHTALISFVPPHDISFILANSGLAVYYVPRADITAEFSNLPKPVIRYYTHKEFNIGQTLKVRFLYKDPGLGFYVAPVDSTPFNDVYHDSEYRNVTRELFIGYGLIYKRKHKLQRAIVVDTIGRHKAEVRLIDTGEVITAHVNNLFDGPPSVFTPLIQTIFCTTFEEEFQMPYADLKKYFIEGVEFYVTIKELGERFSRPHTVVISDVKL